MLENKADFIIEYNETLKQNLKREDVDWSQTRVAFVSTSFTENQILATNFKDIAIELWEIKRFENNLFSVSAIKKTRSAESIKPVMQQNNALIKVIDEIKVYTEDEHIDSTTEEIAELYKRFRDAILNLTDDIEIKPTKLYIAFKKDTNLVDIAIQKKALKIWINARLGTIDDAKCISKDVSNIGHFGNGDYEIQVNTDKELEYIMSLIKQTLK